MEAKTYRFVTGDIKPGQRIQGCQNRVRSSKCGRLARFWNRSTMRYQCDRCMEPGDETVPIAVPGDLRTMEGA